MKKPTGLKYGITITKADIGKKVWHKALDKPATILRKHTDFGGNWVMKYESGTECPGDSQNMAWVDDTKEPLYAFQPTEADIGKLVYKDDGDIYCITEIMSEHCTSVRSPDGKSRYLCNNGILSWTKPETKSVELIVEEKPPEVVAEAPKPFLFGQYSDGPKCYLEITGPKIGLKFGVIDGNDEYKFPLNPLKIASILTVLEYKLEKENTTLFSKLTSESGYKAEISRQRITTGANDRKLSHIKVVFNDKQINLSCSETYIIAMLMKEFLLKSQIWGAPSGILT